MDLDTYLETVVSTSYEDWWRTPCWGAFSAPSFMDRIIPSFVNDNGQRRQEIDVQDYSDIAVLKSDIDISLAWGYPCNTDFSEEWTEKFPDSSASSDYIDFRYRGQTVFREIFVSVDGGRHYFPVPDRDIQDGKIIRLHAPRRAMQFFSMIRGDTRSIDELASQTGIEITDTPWPVF